jgi:hypothetical protein
LSKAGKAMHWEPVVNGRQVCYLTESPAFVSLIKNIMSAAQAFATKEGCKIGFPHTKKAVKANDKFFWGFYGKDYTDANYG